MAVWKNDFIEPDIDRLEACAVCGFAGNPSSIEDTPTSQTVYTTTGTTWRSEDAADQDLVPDSFSGISPTNCAFCGTSRPLTGSPGDLKRGW